MSTQTIQATGKIWKMSKVIGILMIATPLALAFNDITHWTFPVWVACGVIVYVVARTGAWWFHA